MLIDPFHVLDRGDGYSSVEAFAVLAARGVSTILWYAIYDPSDSDAWIGEAIPSTVPAGWSARIVGTHSQGGLAGCGFLTAHLPPECELAAGAMVETLAQALSSRRPGLRVH